MSGRPVHGAAARLAPHLAETPAREALGLDPAGGLVLKLENVQPTGSFKVRGAFSKLLALDASARAAGGIAASTGNHGAAVACAARTLGLGAEVVVPTETPEGRVRAIERHGARTVRHGAECGASEAEARRRAAATGATFVSPYNDLDVMHGQGTLALELVRRFPALARVYVAVGGGGLVGGIARGLSEAGSDAEVVGCSPENDHAMESAVRAGRVVDVPHLPTLSLATAGALEADTVTLPACVEGVTRWERATEAEIADALRALYYAERIVGEGAAGVALACWRRDHAAGRCSGLSAVVICGGNLDPEHLEACLLP